ncbi:SH3 domain-containing protein [Massilia sp. YMA4]|uniref:SH3 domain-containing protein n=1 Tax=[Empedobacter] haloabium TaxID=592317 RepID=A0ABZ1US73_9BURK|nr:SH3 domain-containing protein [Massilia sp. YMA4]AXA91175.1 SH3 domain-containing protein [Massilia sp. YMA4]
MTLAETLHAGHGAPAYLLALALTLALAAALTPRHWWRRPTARGAAVLGGGTWALGALLLAALPLAPLIAAPDAVVEPPRTLAAGQAYRVHRDLNVRAQAGVGAARVTVIAAGALVTPTGERDGDWWRIRYGAAPQRLGWASSLWLRQATEP